MQSLRIQLDALQLQLGSLSADAPINSSAVAGGGMEPEAAAIIEAAHRSAASSIRHAESAPVEMQEFFRRFGVSGHRYSVL